MSREKHETSANDQATGIVSVAMPEASQDSNDKRYHEPFEDDGAYADDSNED